MASLDSDFEELRQRLRDSTRLRNTGGDRIYYLVFAPERMLDVKRRVRPWKVKLEHDDWKVVVVSLANTLDEHFMNHPLRPLWLSGEAGASLTEVNETLRASLVDGQVVEDAILAAQEDLGRTPRGLILVTDVEALHPYLRIGAIEQRLQGRVDTTIVILYPGVRRGQTSLSFLGIYPDDGNYRSTHVGG